MVALQTCGWQSARGVHGPKLVDALRDLGVVDLDAGVIPPGLDFDAQKRIRNWASRKAPLSIATVDRLLTMLGIHLAHLPDDVWLAEAGRGGWAHSPQFRETVLSAVLTGTTARDVARSTGASSATVSRVRQSLQDEIRRALRAGEQASAVAFRLGCEPDTVAAIGKKLCVRRPA